ncbi:nuclear transport factor 2 family protein [Pseudoalteromonas luteoviolacea]|uniref:nuclear transport factor 2 family protein n=1 Tax=Pseudoalteromonas luteoviolacea TaxID=43657 RepID=UPI001B380A1F|nr:nuclear transport factor 2 family protein [Pseudoalteromonas luteoviolacea]MBQ4811315.1 nuclear transport factor 2 family protein [Pseudoalteromonas luteoviolacea]
MHSTNLQDIDAIKSVVNLYFEGLFHGDANTLESIVCERLELKAPNLRRPLAKWLALVAARPVPKDQGESFDYRVLSIDIEGEQAMVKVVCPLLGRVYIDFLGLLKEQGKWLIVSKVYSDIV